jgi:hypothetical protein
LKPIAGVSPTPFLIRFECSAGALLAIPAKAKTVKDMYMMKKTFVGERNMYRRMKGWKKNKRIHCLASDEI